MQWLLRLRLVYMNLDKLLRLREHRVSRSLGTQWHLQQHRACMNLGTQ